MNGAGYNCIDVDAATKAGICVVNELVLIHMLWQSML